MIILGVFLIALPIIGVFAMMVIHDGWRALAFSLLFTASICIPIAAGVYLLSLAGVVE